MRFPVRFAKFLKTFLLEKTSRRLLPCGRIFREFSSAESLFKTITNANNAKNARFTKEVLQRSKTYKRKMNKYFLNLADIWSITDSKFLQGPEAATWRCSIKSVFKNCPKFTENLSAQSCTNEQSSFIKNDFITGFFLWILRNF